MQNINCYLKIFYLPLPSLLNGRIILTSKFSVRKYTLVFFPKNIILLYLHTLLILYKSPIKRHAHENFMALNASKNKMFTIMLHVLRALLRHMRMWYTTLSLKVLNRINETFNDRMFTNADLNIAFNIIKCYWSGQHEKHRVTYWICFLNIRVCTY